MTATQWITAVVAFAIAGLLLVLCVRQFLEKGKPLNNAYLYATEKERERMDLKPVYRQSAIVFCLLSLLFWIIGLSIVLQEYRLGLLEIPVVAATVIYAIVSSVRIARQSRQQENPSERGSSK